MENHLELPDSKNFLDKIINTVASPIFVKNDRYEFCLVNDALCTLLKLPREKLIGSTGYENFPEEQNKVFLAKDREVLETGKENVNEEFLTDGTGLIRTIVTKKTLFTDSKGTKFLVGIINDITDRKKAEEDIKKINVSLEQRVQQRTKELLNSNQELEAFAYSIAHELRSPLRAIHGFSQMLVEEYTSLLDSEGKRKLSVIQHNSSRMDQLITDLLTMAKISRSELKRDKIEIKQLIDQVISQLKQKVDFTKIDIQIGNIPSCLGDETLIQQVWVNLIDNAIKYSRTRDTIHIQIQGILQDNVLVYSIKDNGIGFNPAYQNKLFGAFNRLHTDPLYEGTGIGLAIVERIIHRHGGKVWAEGTPGVGATFYFSLPIQLD